MPDLIENKTYSLKDIATYLNQFTVADIHNAEDKTLIINKVASLASATANDLSFLVNAKHKKQLQHTQASAILIAATHSQLTDLPSIVCQDVNLAFVKLMELFAEKQKSQYKPAIDASAVIDPQANIADSVYVGANSVIGHGCSIGEHTIIHANVTIYPGTTVGSHCIVHAGVVIGADGFGFKNIRGTWHKVEQLGGVIIEDQVEIGANSTIDRGALDNTEIHHGVKIDNQVHIGHNVKVGRNSLLCGCVAIGGSTRIEPSCILAGSVGISDNIYITEGVTITAGSLILQSIDQTGSYSSAPPTMPTATWRRYMITLKSLVEKLRAIQQRLTQLESKTN